MDENKKVVVNLPEGTTQAEIIYVRARPPQFLPPSPGKNRPFRCYRCAG